MAGTVTITEERLVSSAVKKVTFAWSSSAGGAADGTSTYTYNGAILAALFAPNLGATQPDNGYDVLVNDADGIDVLNAQGLNRDNTVAQWVTSSLGYVANDTLTIGVTNANGPGKTGSVSLFIGVSGMPANSYTDLANALYGGDGIATYPAAAVPANNVSLAEVLHSVWAGLMGTAAGENGITTWPAAAAPGNAVSLAEGLRYVVESQIGTLVNTGGATATLAAILGDLANVSLVTRLTNLANQTNRTTAAKAIASIASGNLFTVATGPVSVLSLVGQITTGIENKANACKLTHTPTGGAAVDLCGTFDVDTAAIRKVLALDGVKATALTLSADVGVVIASALHMPIVLTPGTIALNAADTSTGAVSWYVEYEPLAPGATVTAA